MSDVPVGTVVAFAGPRSNIPNGWLLCDGRPMVIADFPALFGAIDISWGGDGESRFCLPDLRGQFLRGVDHNHAGTPTDPPRDPDRDERDFANPDPLMELRGNLGNLVGSSQRYATALPRTSRFQTDNPGKHHHLDPTWGGGPGPFELAVGAARGPGNSDFVPENPTSPDGAHTHAVISGGDEESRPANAYVYWIIKALP